MEITREQAICILFCEEYSERNIAKLSRRLKDLENMDIVYENNPEMPVLVSIKMINKKPWQYQ
ncbi:hypothetical protein DM01DRAFT_18160 [Hesseltinella vesiculosa]|uniref:Uncharacterized protein n=1 Tax=Hesseltinella vesiculosa TaxID=101127 RepID=A0A1X2GIH6_9FUNG|nr:hypothetical protein DM01DRAFT_18160 [Hesseltinella vesiculosa]